MKIQIDSIKMNRTKKYLTPCLKEHGEDFVSRLSKVRKVAYGFADMIIGKKYEKHIFILINTSKCLEEFVSLLSWLKGKRYYEDDYAFDSLHSGVLHMIVVKLPEICYGKFNFFTKGEYSKMYSLEQIQQIKSDEVKRVLIKDHNYKLSFTKKLNEYFGTNLTPKEIGDRELDLPPTIEVEEEIF